MEIKPIMFDKDIVGYNFIFKKCNDDENNILLNDNINISNKNIKSAINEKGNDKKKNDSNNDIIDINDCMSSKNINLKVVL